MGLLINTKITNYYLIFASQKTSSKDTGIMKGFKNLINQLKDLGYIQSRFLIVDGKMKSRETRESERAGLEKSLAKLGKLKAQLEGKIIFQEFEKFKDEVLDSVRDKIPEGNDTLSHLYEYVLFLFHYQYMPKESKIVEGPDYWISPYSEISKMTQLSFKVEYQAGEHKEIKQMDLPFVIRINVEAFTNKEFPIVFKNDIRRYALRNLKEQGIGKDMLEDVKLRLVNQPEIIICAFDGSFLDTEDEKPEFYKTGRKVSAAMENFCNSLEVNDFQLDKLFMLNKGDKITKRYYPKHILLWNTKYS